MATIYKTKNILVIPGKSKVKNLHLYSSFRWCVLFSHPSDFTPVCTTELGRIAVHQPHFAKRNVKLIAHSVDDLTNHVDWVNVKFTVHT